MAQPTIIKGRDIGIYLGDILVGCADDISLSVSVGEDQTSCRAVASSAVNTFEPGNIDITGSVSGVTRIALAADAATNVTAENILDIALARTIVTFRFTVGDFVGAPRYTAPGFFTQADISGSQDGNGSFSSSIRINEMPVKTIQAA